MVGVTPLRTTFWNYEEMKEDRGEDLRGHHAIIWCSVILKNSTGPPVVQPPPVAKKRWVGRRAGRGNFEYPVRLEEILARKEEERIRVNELNSLLVECIREARIESRIRGPPPSVSKEELPLEGLGSKERDGRISNSVHALLRIRKKIVEREEKSQPNSSEWLEIQDEKRDINFKIRKQKRQAQIRRHLEDMNWNRIRRSFLIVSLIFVTIWRRAFSENQKRPH